MTEKKEEKNEGSPSPEAQNMLYFWGVGGLIIGLIIGFLVFPGMAGAPDADGTTVATGEEVSEAFVLDQSQVSRIAGFLQDYYFTYTGSETTVTFTRYVDKGAYVELYYNVAGEEMPIYISKDYVYLYSGVFETDATISQMQDMKQQMMEQAAAEAAGVPQSEEPEVLMFVMSYCPYGNQAENGLAPVVELLGEEAAFEPVYIIYLDASSSGYECAEYEGTEYCSMHGNAELWQDVREKIIFNMYGEKKWAEYVYKTNADCSISNIDTCWETAADAVGGINTSAVVAEFEANKFAIIQSEVAKTNEYMVSGSPTIIINGYTYSGARTPEGYKEVVCSAFSSEPADCSEELSEEGGDASGSC